MTLLITYLWNGTRLVRRSQRLQMTARDAVKTVHAPWVLAGDNLLRRAKRAAVKGMTK